ncbi:MULTISPECIES: hypothetical protein [unclassified Streptomyces]|uniref:hypothetical protein n=1 Tax=unclassified Streptomyces TaxID=2593676 RepID=UPI001907528B|nr:hypothetical protein [Streptomyces sp. HSG2]
MTLAARLAHGVGSRHDLPVSAFHAYAGAFAALLFSFLALGLLWPESRYRGDHPGRPLPAALGRAADSAVLRRLLRAAGLLAAAAVLLHLWFGAGDPDRNPAPGAVYVLLWCGLIPASLLLGPVWSLLNPLRTLHALACRILRRPGEGARPDLARRLGHWPAAAGLLVFTWLELASPDPTSPLVLSTFLLGYAAVQLTGAAVCGRGWFERCDAFEVYSALLGRLSPLGRAPNGRLVLRGPLHRLAGTPPVPGLVAAVCVLLGGTMYDGVSGTPSWTAALQTSPLGRTGTATVGLLATTAGVALLYLAAAGAVGLIAGPVARPVAAFAHSLVPIVAGYLVAHYFTLLTTEGPRTVALAFGGDGGSAAPDPPLSPGGVATLQVTAVVLGHVLGVVAAHDRAVRSLPPSRAVAGGVPLLMAMVCYTLGGIRLLVA